MKAAPADWLLQADQADFDLLQDLREKTACSPLTWKCRWIRGHQDKNASFEDLNR
jgi:hypothetical protein